jgi:hypothetical protein
MHSLLDAVAEARLGRYFSDANATSRCFSATHNVAEATNAADLKATGAGVAYAPVSLVWSEASVFHVGKQDAPSESVVSNA